MSSATNEFFIQKPDKANKIFQMRKKEKKKKKRRGGI